MHGRVLPPATATATVITTITAAASKTALRTKDLTLLMKLQTTTDMNLLNPATISTSGCKDSVAEEHQMDS